MQFKVICRYAAIKTCSNVLLVQVIPDVHHTDASSYIQVRATIEISAIVENLSLAF